MEYLKVSHTPFVICEAAASELTIRQDEDDAKGFNMPHPPSPLLASFLVLKLSNGLGPSLFELFGILLRGLRGFESCLICFAPTFGKVTNSRRKTRLEI